MSPTPPASTPGDSSLLPGVTRTRVTGRRAIEDCVDRLNRVSRMAERLVDAWGEADGELSFGAVDGLENAGVEGLSLAECRMDVGLTLHARDPLPISGACVVGLPVTGRITALSRGRDIACGPGEALVLDPAEVVRSRVAPGTHFVEFTLPANVMRRLAAEWAPGLETGMPRFQPLVSASLARRLLVMAGEMASVAATRATAAAADDALARERVLRWAEMIGLTLLHEQPDEALRHGRRSAGTRRAGTSAVRRAMDFIHAHADSPIGLDEIAAAACVSVRTLIRHFGAQLGESPAACLRGIRLDRARAALQARPDLAVRDIACAWGFQNASKFTEAYKRRFGETPASSRRPDKSRRIGP